MAFFKDRVDAGKKTGKITFKLRKPLRCTYTVTLAGWSPGGF